MFPSKGRKCTVSSYHVYETRYSFFCFQIFQSFQHFRGTGVTCSSNTFKILALMRRNWTGVTCGWWMRKRKYTFSGVLLWCWFKIGQIQQTAKYSFLLWYFINLTNSESRKMFCLSLGFLILDEPGKLKNLLSFSRICWCLTNWQL